MAQHRHMRGPHPDLLAPRQLRHFDLPIERDALVVLTYDVHARNITPTAVGRRASPAALWLRAQFRLPLKCFEVRQLVEEGGAGCSAVKVAVLGKSVGMEEGVIERRCA